MPSEPRVTTRRYAERMPAGTGPSAKGDLVRALATSRPRIATARGLIDWAGAAGLDVRAGAEGELDLVV